MGEYQWCPYCGRASKKRDKWRVVYTYKGTNKKPVDEYTIDAACPFEGCDRGWDEMEDWDRMRKIKPKLPEIPEEGKLYSVKGMCKGFF